MITSLCYDCVPVVDIVLVQLGLLSAAQQELDKYCDFFQHALLLRSAPDRLLCYLQVMRRLLENKCTG